MASRTLRREERAALGVAIALHALVLAALLLQPRGVAPPAPPERMTVSLAEDVGLVSEAPEPVADSRAAQAPVLSPQPAPAPAPAPAPQPAPPVPQPAPAPVVSPAPARPVPRATAPARPARPAAKPAVQPRPASAAPARTAAKPAAKPAARTGGASRLGADFLEGAGASSSSNETRAPAARLGAQAKADLFAGIARKLRQHNQALTGPDVNLLVSKIRFRLNRDGSLAGRPQLLSQSGVNDANRAQADRHSEQAIRAVQLAAPFDLPPEHYDVWKTVTVDFDRKLMR